MYGLTNFISVLWYSVAGWLGIGHGAAQAVTLFDGRGTGVETSSSAQRLGVVGNEDDSFGGANLDVDVRYTHPHGWGFDTKN